jgi:acetylornithine deacetylase/succinyl-diaminopimelate desuccinylase-like protein
VPAPADLAEGRALLRELVDLDTTHPKGTTRAAHALEAHFLAAGFAPADVTFIAPAEHLNSGNLIVHYRGKTANPAVLFLGHLDVVAANPEDWTVDPFQLIERDGWFYGRGTADMKDGDAALAAALLRLHREGWQPDHDVIAAFTADEEAGGDANGPAFLLKAHRSLIDAAVAYNLDGGGGGLDHGRRTFYDLGTSEKTYVTYTLETTAPGGHGSLPGPDNPIYRLARALGRLEAYQFPVMTTATTRAYFKAMADLEPSDASADLRAVAAVPPDLGAAGRLSTSVFLNAQLHTTCVATLLSGGHAENALPQRARATVQCRMMPGDSPTHVLNTLTDVIAEPAITITQDAAPIVSPESVAGPAVLDRVTRVVHSMWPGVALVPSMATGFSDDRQTRNAGIPSYDVSGLWMENGENRAHGRDERIGVREFDESVEYVYRLVREMGITR